MDVLSWKKGKDGSTTYLLLYSEQRKFYVEEFFQPQNGLQNRTHSFSYASKQLALEKYRFLGKGFHQGNPPPPPSSFAIANNGPIWPAQFQWDLAWEKNYEAWVKANFHADFFIENQIATDCADAAIALRWIFSRIHFLPAAQTLAGSSFLFTNEMVHDLWRDLPTHEDWRQDQRFRAALDYILKNTYTHSLMKDLYPIAIRRDSFHPGTVILNLYDQETGHTEIIADLATDENAPEPIRVLASDVPRDVRRLNEYPMQDWGLFPIRRKSGFHRFRWPVQTPNGPTLQPEDQMPYFSEEQFSESFARERPTLTEAVIYRLFPRWNPDYSLFMRSLVEQTLQRFQARVKIVSDGFTYCSRNDCAEGTAGWEAWSTPSRDQAILRLVGKINNTYRNVACDRNCRNMLLSRMNTPILQIGTVTIHLREALETWGNLEYSSDPRDPIAVRWGLNQIQGLPPSRN